MHFERICIIPARAGSKRIKNKNIKKFFKQPIISYAIKEAIKSKLFDKVIVSTDSKKIANIAKKYGGKIFFLRPKKISNDSATTQEVIIHSLNWFKKKKIFPKIICCIYPATPLLKYKDLKKSYLNFKKKKWEFMLTAIKYSSPIQRSLYFRNKRLKPLNLNNFKKKTQDLKDFYYDARQFYWGTDKAWKKKDTIKSCRTTIYEMSRFSAIDINDIQDWELAKILFKKNKIKK